MELENQAVIDVQAEEIDSSLPESIEHWYSAAQVQQILQLNKSGLQKAIAKLQDIYGIDLKILRRGEARATQYSELALKACKLLNAGKLSELRKLFEAAPTTSSATTSTAIVFVEQHHQIALNAGNVADSNLTQIASFKSGYWATTENWGGRLENRQQQKFGSDLLRKLKQV